MSRALLAACALALAACGTTVPLASQSAGSGSQSLDGTSSTAGGTTETAPVDAATGAPVPAAPVAEAATGGAGTTGTTGTTSTTGAVGRPSSAAPTTGRGTLSTLEVGVIVYPDVSAAASALGGKAGNTSNQETVARAMIAWVNAHGGLAGHPLKLVVHTVNLTSTQTYAQEEDDACTDFAQDHHATVVVTTGSSIDNQLPLCLQRKHVLYLTGGHYLHDETDFTSARNMIAPGEASMSNVGRALADEMTTRGSLKSGDTVGILTEDAPAGLRTTNNVIIPTLKAKGIKVINYTIHGPSSTGDIANSAAAIQSAELRMAASGVKNIAFVCKGCLGLFLPYAESQSFYPRYFLQSVDGIGALAGKGHSKSLNKAIALSWEPLNDVGGYTHPKEFTGNAARAACQPLVKKYVTDDTSEFVAQSFCGGFLDLYAAGQALKGTSVNDVSLMAGFDTFGTSHVSAVSFATRLSAGRHAGAVGYRRMSYAAGCDCFTYDSHALIPFVT